MSECITHDTPKASLTYRYDRIRGAFQGILDAAWMTFLLLIAIRVFDASSTIKSCIISSGFWGYVLNPFCIAFAAWTGLNTSKLASICYFTSGIMMLISAFMPSLAMYACLIMLWQFISCQIAPLMIQVYSDNYTPQERGQKCSTTFLLASIGGSLFSYLGGRFLDIHLDYYRWILITIACASFINTFIVMHVPSKALKKEHAGNPWDNFSLLWKDGLFGWILISWTLMSLAQWMIMPLRIEYMANPTYEWCATNKQIAIITFIIPAISQILSAKIWGFAFDRLNFMILRSLINICVIGGVLIFFYANELYYLGVGTALMGIGSGGGVLATNIWVTKIAPAEKVSAYMSAHAALSGVRGLSAPFLGYLFLKKTDPITVSWVVCIMGILSIIMFGMVKNHPRMATRSTLAPE